MAFLRAFGSYLPERVVTSEELASKLGIDAAWIVDRSGIRERRYAAESETVVSLAEAAARDCLTRAALAPEDLGMILVASGSPDCFCPGPASRLAAALGLTATPALDLPIASAGSLAALVLASRLADSTGNILIVASEIMSRRINLSPEGRDTAILFGDGAGAALISPTEGFARIADTCLYTDGNLAEALAVYNDRVHMEGSIVIRNATKRIPQAIAELLTRNNLATEGVSAYILHQANLNLITRIATSLKIPLDRFPVTIERYGNTSSASMLIAAAEWSADSPQAPIILSAFGAGINWGAILATPVS